MPFRSLYVSDSTAVALDGMEEVVGSIPTRSTNQSCVFLDFKNSSQQSSNIPAIWGPFAPARTQERILRVLKSAATQSHSLIGKGRVSFGN